MSRTLYERMKSRIPLWMASAYGLSGVHNVGRWMDYHENTRINLAHLVFQAMETLYAWPPETRPEDYDQTTADVLTVCETLNVLAYKIECDAREEAYQAEDEADAENAMAPAETPPEVDEGELRLGDRLGMEPKTTVH